MASQPDLSDLRRARFARRLPTALSELAGPEHGSAERWTSVTGRPPAPRASLGSTLEPRLSVSPCRRSEPDLSDLTPEAGIEAFLYAVPVTPTPAALYCRSAVHRGAVDVERDHTGDADEDHPGAETGVFPAALGPRGLPGPTGSTGPPGPARPGATGATSAAASASRRRQVAASTPVPAERGTTASERAGAVVPPSRMRPARTRTSSRPPAGARLIHRRTCSPRMTTPPDRSRYTVCSRHRISANCPAVSFSCVPTTPPPPPLGESNKHRTLVGGAERESAAPTVTASRAGQDRTGPRIHPTGRPWG